MSKKSHEEIERDLTPYERKLWIEVDRILYQNYLTPRTVTDFWAGDREGVIAHLKRMKERVIRTVVINEYVELDDVLNRAILKRMFGGRRTRQYARRKTVQEMLDRMYPQQKIDVIKTFRKVPASVYNSVMGLNTLRNSLAHRFDLAAIQKSRRLYKGKYDVFTRTGLKKFGDDMWEVNEYFQPEITRLAYGLVLRQRSINRKQTKKSKVR